MTVPGQTSLVASPFQVRIWQPGYTFSPGDVVQPTAGANGASSPPTNADFVASLTGWTAGTGYSWDGGQSYNSTGGAAKFVAGSASAQIVNTNQVAVTVGQVINAQFYGMMLTAPTHDAGFVNVRFVWYDSGHTLLSTTDATQISISTYGGSTTWWKVTGKGTAPANAAYCSIAALCQNPSDRDIWIDAFSWDFAITGTAAPNYFTDITTTPATSGATEPDWTNGGTNTGNVTDGGITWARGTQTIIYWWSVPFNISGGAEPTWNTNTGGVTVDGGVSWLYGGNGKIFDWITHTPQVQDANCPQNKYVVLASSKIYSADKDIVRFCATTNPMDWTSVADAGFLPSGLQTYGANETKAMGLYRSNLVVFNSEGLQVWQLDEDPANMSLLTAIPVGSIWHKALAPVNNDLFFLAAQGVRTMGITAGSGNVEAGDVGMPIDAMVQAGVAYCAANGTEPIATYYPSAGQYWIHFPGWQASGLFYATPANTSNVFVYTMNRTGEVGAWSRYNFPFPTIDAFCQLNDVLYVRSGDDVLSVDTAALYDYAGDTYLGGNRQVAFQGVVQWPWLDFGQPGVTKQIHGIDVASTQSTTLTVQLGYDQADFTAYTSSFTQPGDSYYGTMIPIPIMAPSASVRLIMTSTDNWQIQAVNIYLKDARVTS